MAKSKDWLDLVSEMRSDEEIARRVSAMLPWRPEDNNMDAIVERIHLMSRAKEEMLGGSASYRDLRDQFMEKYETLFPLAVPKFSITEHGMTYRQDST